MKQQQASPSVVPDELLRSHAVRHAHRAMQGLETRCGAMMSSNQPWPLVDWCRFEWRFGGKQVFLCGSFTRWVETVPMALTETGAHAATVYLPPGYYQYKFIVDGTWRHDETAPYTPDPLGNLNNWLFVRRVESGLASQIPSIPVDPQQLLVAQQQQQQQHLVQQQQQLLAASATVIANQVPVLPFAAPLEPHHQLHAQHPQEQAQLLFNNLQHTAPAAASPEGADVDMANAEALVPPLVIHNPKEPEYTRKKVSDFLHSHSAYELIPESGKVVVLDVDLPVRQAFHALHEQGIASAPLWDGMGTNVIGVISASDFISILTRLRNSVSSGANPMSEAEMDAHTIRGLREQATLEGREPKALAYTKPEDDLAQVVATLSTNKCSMAPILSSDPSGPEVPNLLHLCTLSGVLACLMRHFRASLASLPLLSQPLGSLPLGTWSPDASVAHTDVLPDSKDRRQWRKLQPLHTVTPSTLLTTALSMLLETGVSCLPVVDDKRCLLDIYARSDITQLCKGNAYNRLQWEDVTVGQALSLSSATPGPWSQHALQQPQQQPMPLQPGMGGLAAELQQAAKTAAQPPAPLVPEDGVLHAGMGPGGKGTRVHVCSKDDTLRTVVERLATPGVRRLVVIQPETRRVEGLISLSDVASYLFL